MDPTTPLDTVIRLDAAHRRGLERLNLTTVRDLLLYLPARYVAEGEIRPIASLQAGEHATVFGRIIQAKPRKTWRTRIPVAEATLEDESGRLKLIWYHQAYMAKKFPSGSHVKVDGKISDYKGTLSIANPRIELPGGETTTGREDLFSGAAGHATRLVPVYPETRGVSSAWIEHAIGRLLRAGAHDTISDPLPPALLKQYNLPSLKTALVWIHRPERQRDAEAARKRFSFNEIFGIQLARLRDRATYRRAGAYSITATTAAQALAARFPFPLTRAQERAIEEILKDLRAEQPMTRLLEGDVGSGKTAVAAITAAAVVAAGYEVAYMAPTEVLARQHFESFIACFRHLPIQVGLLTGTECRKFPSKIDPAGHTHIARTQLLRWVAEGQIPILIGTHALIEKSVRFRNLAYVIIDEQHRFGVMQRSRLARSGTTAIRPHLLSMTATPIPRTLALTLYGDLDVSLLDELPAGRRPVITRVIGERERTNMYAAVRKELAAGRQAFVICPRIEEPDPKKELALQVKSATAEAARLRKDVFPGATVGLLHSKLAPKTKEETMAAFATKEIDILVATSVVEVGINVPNATVIMIEGAERFGLAQLHQLRGRVSRSSHQAFCYLITDAAGSAARARLSAIEKARSGFELAELDLTLRGPGTLTASTGQSRQWGLSDVGMAALTNLKMVQAARAEAAALLASDPDLTKHPDIKKWADARGAATHFE